MDRESLLVPLLVPFNWPQIETFNWPLWFSWEESSHLTTLRVVAAHIHGTRLIMKVLSVALSVALPVAWFIVIYCNISCNFIIFIIVTMYLLCTGPGAGSYLIELLNGIERALIYLFSAIWSTRDSLYVIRSHSLSFTFIRFHSRILFKWPFPFPAHRWHPDDLSHYFEESAARIRGLESTVRISRISRISSGNQWPGSLFGKVFKKFQKKQ